MRKAIFAVFVLGLMFFLKSGSIQFSFPSFINDAVNKIPSSSNPHNLPSGEDIAQFLRNNFKTLTSGFRLATPSPTTLPSSRDPGSILEPIQKITDQVIAPSPIEQKPTEATTSLSRVGVIHRTNTERILRGLPPLKENTLLNRAAQIKANDLFTKQYFAHISPSGQGIATVVTAQGYQYAVVGENLALGRFDDDTALVDAWMASIGHRMNILNSRYEDIGAAVTRGIYQGLETWVAVQVFGLPLQSCPAPDTNLRATIDAKKTLLNSLDEKAKILKQEIITLSRNDPSYQTKFNEYNNLIPQMNTIIDELVILIKKYNEQVQLLNSCIS